MQKKDYNMMRTQCGGEKIREEIQGDGESMGTDWDQSFLGEQKMTRDDGSKLDG